MFLNNLNLKNILSQKKLYISFVFIINFIEKYIVVFE